MQRIATTTLACVILLTSVAGCSLFKKKDKAADAYDPASMPVADPGYAAYPSDAGGTVGMGGGRYHTVQKKETLYSISRQYYGDHTKWKDIYAANKSEIGDPNKIRVGQKLVIP
jgi:nucleoid-associated protein YgaU